MTVAEGSRRSARHVLGMDLGTSSLKCVVLDESGAILASASRSYPTQSPHPGWAEQDPADWLAALKGAIADLRAQSDDLIERVAAVGICSAAHIPVLLDAADRILRPAILWSDQRSSAEVAALRAEHGALLETTALNEAGCTWTLPQLLWIWNHEPDVLPRVRSFLSSKDYLVFRLTGERVMDHGSAAATLMLDGHRRQWSSVILELSRLPDSAVPTLASPTDTAGHITPEAAAAFGLPAGIPVVAGTLDSAAEMVGCGVLASGESGMVRVGSAGGVMAVTDRAAFHRGVITYPHVLADRFYKQAGTNACATSLKWIRDLGQALPGADATAFTYETMDRLAAEVAPGAEGLMFHPYLQGERAPHWSADVRGSFTGLDLRHGWPHMVRAVMEGVAFSLRDGLAMFERDGLGMTSAVMSGGVLRSPVWTQIITDVLGMETRTIRQGDSALGAAMLAAIGAGLFRDVAHAVSECVVPEATQRPVAQNTERYAGLFERYRRVGTFLVELADCR